MRHEDFDDFQRQAIPPPEVSLEVGEPAMRQLEKFSNITCPTCPNGLKKYIVIYMILHVILHDIYYIYICIYSIYIYIHIIYVYIYI